MADNFSVLAWVTKELVRRFGNKLRQGGSGDLLAEAVENFIFGRNFVSVSIWEEL